MQNFWEKDKVLKIFDKNLHLFLNFSSNFEADFGNTCDYHKSVTKILEIFMTPLKFFKKGTPGPQTFWPCSCMQGDDLK